MSIWLCSRSARVALIGVGLLAGIAAQAAPSAPLNDTALRRCLVDDVLVRKCQGTGQDAALGRDVTRPRDTDGDGGFSFVKLDQNGAALPADASEWSCVLDRVSGLTWEVKTGDGGPHDYRLFYTAWGDFLDGDASLLVRSTNRERLCGHDDWRMPSRLELLGIAHFDRSSFGPYIDEAWFPHTGPSETWTASVDAGNEREAWTVGFGQGFSDGVTTYTRNRWDHYYARLVSAAAPPAEKRFVPRGDQVLDRYSRLIWRRCVEGQQWDGAGCAGELADFRWAEALAHADEVARQTGVAWRLPNAKELASLIDDAHFGPSLDPKAFGAAFDYYSLWSSTVLAWYPSRAYEANVWFGSLSGWLISEQNKVRLVRDAQ